MGSPVLARLAHCGVEIRHQPIAAARDICGIPARSPDCATRRIGIVALGFRIADFPGVPAPWQMQSPVAPMRSEQRAEGGKLEPPRIQFARKFVGRNKPADVCSPVWNAAQARIHSVRNVRLQRLPAREHVAGPQECRVALHPRIRVAMQCVDAPIGPVQLLAIEVHASARQPRRCVQAISLVGPPAIDPQIDKRPMHRPVAGDLAVGRPMAIGGSAERQRRGGAGIAHGTGEVFAFQYNMQHHFEVFVVELRHGPRGIGKSAGIPGEFAVVGVPAVGTKAGAENKSSRHREVFFLPEGARPPPESPRADPGSGAIADSRAPRAVAFPGSRRSPHTLAESRPARRR